MPTGKVNWDRGVIIKTHPISGIDVYMYVDTPGVYMTAHEDLVSTEFAAAAGYDVERFGKEKLRKERMAQAMSLIEAELSDDYKEETVAETDGFKIVTFGLGRHNVLDPDGNRLNTIPLPKEQAEHLLASLTKKDAAPAVKQAKK